MPFPEYKESEFCEVCGKQLSTGQISLCDRCFRDQYGPEDWPEADDPEEMDYELQGGF